MHQPKKWWIGLPILAGVVYGAANDLTPRIEADLTARVAAQVAQHPEAFAKSRIEAQGRDVTVSGVALADKHRVFAQLRADPGLRTLTDATTTIAFVQPFALTMARRGGEATLSGHLPLTGEKEKLAAELSAAGLTVADQTAYAAGAPQTFGALADFAATQLARLDPAQATLSDAELTISGTARDDASYDAALAALKTPPAGAHALKGDILPPHIAAYAFSASIGPGMITLGGHLPNVELRRAVVAHAAALGHGAAITDALRLGSGAPEGDYSGAVDAALAALGQLAQGKVTIDGAALTIVGEGRANIDADAVTRQVGEKLPNGFQIAKVDVESGPVAPYRLNVSRKTDTVTLAGYAPDDASRQRMIDFVRRSFPGAMVNDRLSVAKGAPAHYVEAIDAGLDQLARLDEGEFAMTDATVALSGVARYPQAQNDIAAALPGVLPPGFRGESHINAKDLGAPMEAEACRAALGAFSQTTFRFTPDDSALAPESTPTIEKLAETTLRCPNVTLEVGGHLDANGIEEITRARSKHQAQAIVDRLVRAGADPSRVSAMGYGSERPIAPNDSEDHRARNRRIEFAVK